MIITVRGLPAPQGSKRHVGNGVMIESSKAVKPWREAVKWAALAAIPDLDTYHPRLGQCLICGVPGEDQRHRVVDAIADRVRAGDSPEDVAADYEITLPAVEACLYPLTGPVCVDATFAFPRPKHHYRTGRNAHLLREGAPTAPAGKPDLDKLLRSTFDALTDAGVWRDDSQVTAVTARKVYGETAGAELRVEGAEAQSKPGLYLHDADGKVTPWSVGQHRDDNGAA